MRNQQPASGSTIILHLGISSLSFVQRFSPRSFIQSQTSSQLHIRDIIHMYSEIFIWPMKQAQSSCSYTTAELLIKQHITHSEHCKPQLIRLCPSLLHITTPTVVGGILTSLPVKSWHVSCPLLKGKLIKIEREREGEGRRDDLHTWAVWREEGRQGGRRGDWTAVAWQPPQAQEEETSRTSLWHLLDVTTESDTAHKVHHNLLGSPLTLANWRF